MNQYVYAPAGPVQLQTDCLKECIEAIGELQPGFGSKYAKGKRYIKATLKCSGKAIKRAAKTVRKVSKHDFETYGLRVYYYHSTDCSRIVNEVIEFMRTRRMYDVIWGDGNNHDEAGSKEYLDQLYRNRINQLQWVVDTDYMKQATLANLIVNQFKDFGLT